MKKPTLQPTIEREKNKKLKEKHNHTNQPNNSKTTQVVLPQNKMTCSRKGKNEEVAKSLAPLDKGALGSLIQGHGDNGGRMEPLASASSLAQKTCSEISDFGTSFIFIKSFFNFNEEKLKIKKCDLNKNKKNNYFSLKKIISIFMVLFHDSSCAITLKSPPVHWDITTNLDQSNDGTTLPSYHKDSVKVPGQNKFVTFRYHNDPDLVMLELIDMDIPVGKQFANSLIIHKLLFHEAEKDSLNCIIHFNDPADSKDKIGFAYLNVSDPSSPNFVFPTTPINVPNETIRINNQFKRDTFLYYKFSGYIIFTFYSNYDVDQANRKYNVSVRDTANFNSEIGSIEITTSVPVALFKEDYFASSTRYWVLNFRNGSEFLRLYNYPDASPVPIQTITATLLGISEGIASATKGPYSRLIEYAPPVGKNNFIAFAALGNGTTSDQFIDVNVKTAQVRNHNYYTHTSTTTSFQTINAITDTGYYIIRSIYSTPSDKIWLINNHLGLAVIESQAIELSVVSSVHSYGNSGNLFRIHPLNYKGEVMIEGKDGSSLQSIFTVFQFIEPICHPSCADAQCAEADNINKCSTCRDAVNMTLGGASPNTCTCPPADPKVIDIASNTCINEGNCTNFEIEVDGIKQCLTEEQCYSKGLYPVTHSTNTKECLSWEKCGFKSNLCFDPSNGRCIEGVDENAPLALVFKGYNFCVKSAFCEGVAGLTTYLVNSTCGTKCQTEEFYYSSTDTCNDAATCRGIDSGVTMPDNNTIYPSCTTQTFCQNHPDKVVYISGGDKTCVLFSEVDNATELYVVGTGEWVNATDGCPTNHTYLRPSTNYCYSEENCETQSIILKKADNGNATFCLTEDECKSEVDFRWNPNNSTCMFKDDCLKTIINGTETCYTNCPTEYPYFSSTGNNCYNESHCTADSKYFLEVTVGNVSGKICVNEAECKTTVDLETGESIVNETSWHLENSTCIPTTDCTVDLNATSRTCRSNCTNDDTFDYIGKDDMCYSSTTCGSVRSGYFVNNSGTKQCLTADECKNETGVYYLADSPDCILEANCTFFAYGENGTCYNACPSEKNYTSISESKCYSEQNCTDDGRYPVMITNTSKYCFKEGECKNQTTSSGDDETFFNVDSDICELKINCTHMDYPLTQRISRDNCSEEAPYFHKTDRLCYNLTDCVGLPLFALNYGENSYCANETDCKNETFVGVSWNVDNSSCMLTEECLAFDASDITAKTCRNSCPAAYPNLIPSNRSCVDNTTCNATRQIIEYPSGEFKCVDEIDCKATNGISWILDGIDGGLNSSTPVCVVTDTGCNAFVPEEEDGTCRFKCPNSKSFIDPETKLCYSFLGCNSANNTADAELYAVANSTRNLCVTETYCKNATNSELKWNLDTNTCILTIDCGGKLVGDCDECCRTDCPANQTYMNPITFLCYNETECLDAGYRPVLDGGNDHCVNETECKDKDGLSWSTEGSYINGSHINGTYFEGSLDATPTCILTEDCSAFDTSLDYPSVCVIECPSTHPYRNPTTRKCYNDTDCTELFKQNVTNTPGPHSFCVNKEECKKQTDSTQNITGVIHWNNETQLCILTSECGGFVLSDPDGECRSECPSTHVFKNPTTKICYENTTTCEAATQGNLTQYSVETGPSVYLSHCVTEAECKSESGLSWNLNTFDCILTENCGAFDEADPAGTCRTNCTLDASYIIPSNLTCKSNTTCEAQPNTYALTVNSSDYCLNEADCKTLIGASWLEDETTGPQCILTPDCPKRKSTEDGGNDSVCYNNCPSGFEYLNPGTETCYSEIKCNGVSGLSAINITSSNTTLCLNETECKSTNLACYNLDTSACVLRTNLIFYSSLDDNGTCRNTCPSSDTYYNDFTRNCYNITNCTSLGNKEIQVDGKDLCLTVDECKSYNTSTVRYNLDTETCMLIEHCNIFGDETIDGTGTCRNNTCPTDHPYYQDTNQTCYTSSSCTLLGLYTVTLNGNGLCLTKQQCEEREGTSWNNDTSNCIPTTQCGAFRNDQREAICLSSCPTTPTDYSYFNPISKNCYSSTECTDIYKIPFTTGSANYCMTQEECMNSAGFRWNLDSDQCVLETSCTFFEFEGAEGTCLNACPTLKEYVNPNEKTCYPEDCGGLTTLLPAVSGSTKRCYKETECKTSPEGFMLMHTSPKTCILPAACIPTDANTIWLSSDRDCVRECPADRFLQELENACVLEADCKNGKGNSITKHCVSEKKASESSSEYTYTTDDKGNSIAKPKATSRLSRGGSDQVKLYADLDIPQSIFEEALLKVAITTGDTLPDTFRRRRILADDITPDKIEVEKASKETTGKTGYNVYFASPTNSRFFATLVFDNTKEFVYTENDEEKKLIVGTRSISYDIEAVPVPPVVKEKPKEASKNFGYLTAVYDVYLRYISPFIPFTANTPFAVQTLFSQDYQRLYIFSRMNFWKGDEIDSLYFNTFKDWPSELSKIIIGETNQNKEIERECEKERERFCFFEINRSLITKGLISIVLSIIFVGLGFGLGGAGGKFFFLKI